MSAAAGVGVGVGIGMGYGFLQEYAKLGALYAKWHLTPYEMKAGCIAHALQSILNAEKDEVSGLSTAGSVQAIHEFITDTINFAWLTDEAIASQMFVQMIQQSIAYAIHSSHAGSIGTIGNVYSGSMYLSGMEASYVGEQAEFLTRGLRGFLSAETGLNTPTMAFNLVRGANRRLEDVYRSITRQMDSLLDEWNDLTLSYYRHYHSMCRERFADAIKMKETATDRAYGLLEQIANEHLARIVEQLDTLEGAKYWFDANLMDADELANISLRIDLEVKASQDDYDEHKTAVLNAIDDTVEEWDIKLNQALNDLTDSEYRFCLLVRQIFDEAFVDVAEFVRQIVEMCDNSVTDVCAYRNVKPSVKIVEHDPVTAPVETPNVDLTRIFYRRWQQIPNYTVVHPYTSLNAIKWEQIMLEPEVPTPLPPVTVEVPEYTPLEIRRVEQVPPFTIKYPYTQLPEISWVQIS